MSESGPTRAAMEAAIARASKAGHDLDVELVRVKVSGSRYGYATACSCGWQSTPKSKRIKAFSAGYVHLGEVVGESLLGPVEDERRHRAEGLARTATA